MALVLQCPLSAVASTQAGFHTSHALALIKGLVLFSPTGLPPHAFSPQWQRLQHATQLPLPAFMSTLPPNSVTLSGPMQQGLLPAAPAHSCMPTSALANSCLSSAASLKPLSPWSPVHFTSAACGMGTGSHASIVSQQLSVAPGRPAQYVVLKNLPNANIGDAKAERRACCVLQLLRAQGRTRGLLIPYGYLDLRLGSRLFSATVMQLCCGGTLHDLLHHMMPRVPVREGLSAERIDLIRREAWMEPEFVEK